MIINKTGNIFTTQCQTIVNTINCVGVMGAGIAFEFKLRNPDMFKKYKHYCTTKSIQIGKLWLYKISESEQLSGYQQILNFPTKNNWKYPSKKDYIEKGLENFIASYEKRGIKSIAFPLLGADKGGMAIQESLDIMTQYLEQCSIDVEIWKFDPLAKDDLYEDFKELLLNMSDDEIKAKSKLRVDAIKKIKDALLREDINSINALLRCKGIGVSTLEKAYILLGHGNNLNNKKSDPKQGMLF